VLAQNLKEDGDWSNRRQNTGYMHKIGAVCNSTLTWVMRRSVNNAV